MDGWIRLLQLICPFISSFFFLYNFQTLKFFVTLFSGTLRPRRLKLGTHVNSGQLYRVYQNQAAAAYLFLFFFFSFLSLQFSNLKHFCCTFLGNCEAYTHEQWVNVSCKLQSGCCFLFVPQGRIQPGCTGCTCTPPPPLVSKYMFIVCSMLEALNV